MNKLKFIPVLAVVSLLSACGESGKLASVKAPKFEKEGTEIEVEKFFEDVDKYAMSLDFNNNKRMSSKEIKSSYAYEDVDTYKREKEVLLHTVYQETDDGVIKYDAPHSLISVKGEYGFYNLEENKAYGNEQREDVSYYESMFQRVQYCLPTAIIPRHIIAGQTPLPWTRKGGWAPSSYSTWTPTIWWERRT